MDQQHTSGSGVMRPLFENDQLPVPSKRAQAEGRQNYAERRISPVVAGLRVTSINPALTMSAGRLRLDVLERAQRDAARVKQATEDALGSSHWKAPPALKP